MSEPISQQAGEKVRWRLRLTGTVQGVGFRPFVFRLASELGLAGWVANTPAGAEIEIEGPRAFLEEFAKRLRAELPPLASILSCEREILAPEGATAFSIRTSETQGTPTALVLPDVATCADCLRELKDPQDRRYRYPFINCTNCGPRYSIILALPYDRPNTTMSEFLMCPACRAEYEDPRHRRFHAQPNACPVCGPHLRLLDTQGQELAQRDEALLRAADALLAGQIIALKGIGGFQLLVDATNEAAVRRLRQRKRREEKPFALMAPSIDVVRKLCLCTPVEEALLRSPEAPIVILERAPSADSVVAPSVAPGNPSLGFMLPYSPLHYLFLEMVQRPIVATSGNLTDEPICTSTSEALERLAGVADLFLTHNRPIARYVDDSVVRVLAGRPVVLRRARGYAPLPVARLPRPRSGVVAFGAHLKNTIALAVDRNIVLSQHIGDLDTEPALRAHERTVNALAELYSVTLTHAVCDAHPDYASTLVAERFLQPTQDFPRSTHPPRRAEGESTKIALTRVPHHAAHIFAAMAEHGLWEDDVLGVAWDGTGLGLDNTIWGSEFLDVRMGWFRRRAHLRPFRALGGDKAMREPRRSALALLAELWDPQAARAWYERKHPHAFSDNELTILERMLVTGFYAPWTCGAGRLFDAVASLLGVRHRCSFEGQAAMELEWLALKTSERRGYPFVWRERSVPVAEAEWSVHPHQRQSHAVTLSVFDWEPMILGILEDCQRGERLERIAARFHATLSESIVQMARKVSCKNVVCAGGCFQNRLLTELVVSRLEQEGYRVFIPEKIPPNDGSIAVGQIAAVAYRMPEE